MKQRILWIFTLGIVLSFPLWATTVYNYFAPGGALSCSGSCTQQSVDLSANAFLLNTLGNAKLANSSITLNGSAVSLGGTRTLNLASADFANQGTTTTVLHGNAAGNPSFGAVNLASDVTGAFASCADTRIPFDNAGVIACSAAFTWTTTTNTLTVGSTATPGMITAPPVTNANGVSLTLQASNGNGVNKNGANVNVNPGAPTGSGLPGYALVKASSGSTALGLTDSTGGVNQKLISISSSSGAFRVIPVADNGAETSVNSSFTLNRDLSSATPEFSGFQYSDPVSTFTLATGDITLNSMVDGTAPALFINDGNAPLSLSAISLGAGSQSGIMECVGDISTYGALLTGGPTGAQCIVSNGSLAVGGAGSTAPVVMGTNHRANIQLNDKSHTSYNGSAPAVSACGTGPSIDTHATDSSGTVTVGTVAAASCTITFNQAYTTWNHCSVTTQNSVTTFAYSYTLSTITVTAVSLVSDKLDYRCDGN